uniref:Uncharacterized protein n=1 Tax=Nelumbo nucifera TaxID=4432 RepID=A0A822ZWG7_NELNU|nr:TPA_asm: hypothetical protein HUJ06_017818 [Nelumbo nucifera]
MTRRTLTDNNTTKKLESGSGLKNAKLLTLIAEEKENNAKLLTA